MRWEPLERAAGPHAGELILYGREGEFVIRADGRELMGSRAHASEERLAALVCAGLAGRRGPRFLVAGLGLGFTLRALLDAAPADAGVVVSELFPQVVDWNRTRVGHLAGWPLRDARVTVAVGDAAGLIAGSVGTFDGVVLDVDNGPSNLTRPANRRFYGTRGLAALAAALRPGGLAGIWSPAPDPPLARRLVRAGFAVEEHACPAAPGRGRVVHAIVLARLRA